MKISKIIFTLCLLSSVVACSGSDPFDRNSDPYKDYPNHDPKAGRFAPPQEIPEVQPAPPEPEPVVQEFRPKAFDINAEKQVLAQRVLNFTEGVATTHRIVVRAYVPTLKFSLKAHDLPEGATLNQGDSADIWLLSWQPKTGLVPQKMDGIETSIKLELLVGAENPVEVKKLYNSEDRFVNFGLAVTKNKTQPKIEKVTLGQGPFKDNEVIPFQVEVSDPSSTDALPPQVYFSYDPASFSGETKLLQGDQGVYVSSGKPMPKRLANGHWVFEFVYKTAHVAQEAKDQNLKTPSVSAEFFIVAISSINNLPSARVTRPLQVTLSQNTSQETAP